MKKFWKTALFCVLLLLIPIFVYGSGTGVYLETCQADGKELQVICSNPGSDGEPVSEDDFRLTLEGTELSVTSVSSVSKERVPVTVYCLVDVSGSMRAEQMEQAKETLYAVCEGLGVADNMVITTLGNRTQTSGFLSDTQRIKETIGQLAAGKEDTNLYAGIKESINVLRTDMNVHQKRCLLILSDGEDDQKTGITREEAELAVKEAHLPVYTVATLSAQSGAESIEYGKLLGSFARSSAGGMHYTPVIDGISGEEAGQDILKSIGSSLVLKAELPELPSDRNELQLRMVYTGSDNSRYEDTLVVRAEDLTDAENMENSSMEESSAEKTSEETIKESDDEEAEDEEETTTEVDLDDDIWTWITSGNRWIWIASGAAALIAVIVLIIIIIIRSRRKKTKADTGTSGASDVNAAPWQPSAPQSQQVPPVSQTQAVTRPVQPQMHQLTLLAIGYTDVEHKLNLPEGVEVTIGRNGKADIILDAEDKKLSGVHCVMKWEDGKIYVRDLDSMNGTYVNGVPIRQMGRVAVHKGETIRIGSYEYRIG